MADFRDIIASSILANRPQLSASSLKTYVSILFNLHKHLKQDHSNLAWFNTNIDDIIYYSYQLIVIFIYYFYIQMI